MQKVGILGILEGGKGEFESLSQWWEVGKVHIRVFCQHYTSHSTTRIRKTIQQLEQDIRDMEDRLHTHHSIDTHTLHQKKQELSTFLQERVNGVLVRARFTTIREMDAPTAFFFNLEKSVSRKKQMVCLRLPDGSVTTDQGKMRRHAVDFYSALYRAEVVHGGCQDELLQGLPQLSSGRQSLPGRFNFASGTYYCCGTDGLWAGPGAGQSASGCI